MVSQTVMQRGGSLKGKDEFAQCLAKKSFDLISGVSHCVIQLVDSADAAESFVFAASGSEGPVGLDCEW